MPTGDIAVSDGMANVNGATTPANTIDTEIMLTRDYIAEKTGKTTPIPIARGGTGGATASAARTALGLGTAATRAASVSSQPDNVVLRDGNGNASIASPTTGAHIANKTYVDAQVGEATGETIAWVDGDFIRKTDASDTPSAGDVAAYNSSGQLRSNDPTSPGHVATKSYVDAHSSDADDGEFSSAPWNRNITWTRRAAWLGDDGSITLGHTASTRAKKQNITPAALAKDALRRIPVVQYRYRAEVAKERKNPDYRAAVEIGTLADDLHKLGLWQFVVYEGRGEAAKPISVHYELLGLAALALAQILADEHEQLEQRVTSLEERLDVLEARS